MRVLGREFYSRDTVEVARDLLGRILVRVLRNGILSGVIVESEAYRSTDDPASHSYRGRTERNSVMFGEVGHAYVYFTYGNHYCLNLVAKDGATPAGAVLIRAIEPLEGVPAMRRRRSTDDPLNIASGPGKLTEALGITKEQNGIDLTTKKGGLYLLDGNHIERSRITATPRIGIRVGLEKQWRFLVADSKFVSKKVKIPMQ
ncbi:MAG: DNA-3-methyladenine glycosylase [Nitrososphaerales archaeon]